jgi:glycosyltransferase involved in cell wall biosynthesis
VKKKNILVVGQYFFPEQFRINDICTQWVKRGYNVKVITGTPNYPDGKFYHGYGLTKNTNEVYNGITIKRIPQIPRGHSSIMLALNYISFVVSGFFWMSFTKEKPDLVFNYEVSPITQALPGVWFAKKRKIPFYMYMTDLWPDNFKVVTGIKSKAVIKPIEKICNYIYKNSDMIFTSSETFKKVLISRGVPENKLQFWPQYAENFYVPLSKEDVKVEEILPDGKFNIVFAGNIGYAQGLEILPQTAELLKNNNLTQIRFCIIGDGRYKETLIKLIEEKNVKDFFCFIDKQPAERISEFMAVCDAALVCLSKSEVFAMTIPSKVQSCMACGIPLIASIDGETQEIIQKSGAGLSCNSEDIQGLYEGIKKISMLQKDKLHQMGENAQQFFKENYEREMLLDKMDEFINQEVIPEAKKNV